MAFMLWNCLPGVLRKLRALYKSTIDSSGGFNPSLAEGETMVRAIMIRQIAFDRQTTGSHALSDDRTNCISAG